MTNFLKISTKAEDLWPTIFLTASVAWLRYLHNIKFNIYATLQDTGNFLYIFPPFPLYCQKNCLSTVSLLYDTYKYEIISHQKTLKMSCREYFFILQCPRLTWLSQKIDGTNTTVQGSNHPKPACCPGIKMMSIAALLTCWLLLAWPGLALSIMGFD